MVLGTLNSYGKSCLPSGRNMKAGSVASHYCLGDCLPSDIDSRKIKRINHMTKLKKNFIVDLLSYICFVLLLGTGLILKYILPHGSGRLVGRGTGRVSGEKLITTLWGMTGEQWGQIHFWLAAAILVLLVFHLVLHWRWISCVLGRKEKPTDVSGGRAFLGLAGMFGVLALVLLPFLTPTEHAARSQLSQPPEISQSADTSIVLKPDRDKFEANSGGHDMSIHGSMTLMDLQNETGIPYKHILEELGLPDNISANEKLGQLRKVYKFSIDDVRKITEEYHR